MPRFPSVFDPCAFLAVPRQSTVVMWVRSWVWRREFAMAKQVGRLTDAAIRGSLKPGMHPDGDGLYLQVRGSSKAWIFRYAVGGRPHWLGLGGYPATSLASARKARDSAREKIRAGGDPIAKKPPAASDKPAAITFREAVDDF